jgi:DNA topoisomerase-2
MQIKEFFDQDFKTFSNLDNVRSIPSLVDGFKDAQRKAVYGVLSNGSKKTKVSQLAGSCSLITHYAHGETSMADTIVGMAQDYPGSNNVNLFEPVGQFGSILSSEAASPRYIFTRASAYMRDYIRPEDDCVLEHRYEDGDKAEPLQYLPVLPMWAVNGSIGIGTGHSVKILPRAPQAVSELVSKLVDGKTPQAKTVERLLKPCFEGWTGEVVQLGDRQFELHGVIEKINTTNLRVTELPVGYGVDKFKSILVKLMDEGKVKDFDNNSTENGFDFEIKVGREVGKKSEDELKKVFKLVLKITENVTLWAPSELGLNALTQFDNVYEAVKAFAIYRLAMYEVRRKKMIDLASDKRDYLQNKMLFIQTWNDIDNAGKKSADQIKKICIDAGVKECYVDGLLNLNIKSLTFEKIDELRREIETVETDIEVLHNSDAGEMYKAELV